MTSPIHAPGCIFFSPAIVPGSGATLDVSSVEFVTVVAESYRSPQPKDSFRPFVLGPAPLVPSGRAWPPDFSASYEPVLNSAEYGLMSNESGHSILGVLTDTGTMVSQIVLV